MLQALKGKADAIKSATFRAIAPAFAFLLAVVLGNVASAQEALGVTGVDVGAYVTLVIAALGTVVGVIVGGYFAFLLIRKAMSWGRKLA